MNTQTVTLIDIPMFSYSLIITYYYYYLLMFTPSSVQSVVGKLLTSKSTGEKSYSIKSGSVQPENALNLNWYKKKLQILSV